MKSESQCDAMTLVEIMVVIAIVAALFLASVFAMGKARATANNVTCMNHLKTLGQGCFAYAADHNGALPFQYVLGSAYSGFGYPLWYVAVAPYCGVRVLHAGIGELDSPGPFKCPADKVPWVGSAGARPSCSYAFPISLAGSNLSAITTSDPSTARMTGFQQPSATVMLVDSITGNVFNQYIYAVTTGTPTDPEESGAALANRHNGLNAVFADGHCERLAGKPGDYEKNRPQLWKP